MIYLSINATDGLYSKSQTGFIVVHICVILKRNMQPVTFRIVDARFPQMSLVRLKYKTADSCSERVEHKTLSYSLTIY